MVQVITPTALGHVGFEMDLRGCDHFDDSDLALWFVGRYNAPLDNTCDRVCALITGGARFYFSSRTHDDKNSMRCPLKPTAMSEM